MGQKITWTSYLLIGISIFILISCVPARIEYKVDADIIYINETEYMINYYQYLPSQNPSKIFIFEIAPNSQKIIESRDGGSKENQNIDNCCQGILEGFQGDASVLVEFDQVKCLIYQDGKGSTTNNILGYESVILSKNYYQFTYRFTENEYLNAENCE